MVLLHCDQVRVAQTVARWRSRTDNVIVTQGDSYVSVICIEHSLTWNNMWRHLSWQISQLLKFITQQQNITQNVMEIGKARNATWQNYKPSSSDTIWRRNVCQWVDSLASRVTVAVKELSCLVPGHHQPPYLPTPSHKYRISYFT